MGVDVKICGLRRQEDAELALELGAFALGFVFEPSSPRYVGKPDWHPGWLAALGGMHVAVYGIVPRQLPSEFGAVQGVEWPYGALKPPQISVKVLRVKVGSDGESVPSFDSGSAMLLLDAYDARAYGGTGKAIDWQLAADICAAARTILHDFSPPVRIGLAGGLTPENVALAVEKVKPDYVDVSTGVESSPGVKDPAKLRAFFAALS